MGLGVRAPRFRIPRPLPREYFEISGSRIQHHGRPSSSRMVSNYGATHISPQFETERDLTGRNIPRACELSTVP